MTSLPSSTSVVPSSIAPRPAPVDERSIEVLISAADRPIEHSLAFLPSIDGCRRAIAMVQDQLCERPTWSAAVAMATRIMACTKARSAEAEDVAVLMSELAKALQQYPPPVAQHATERIIETFKFRPTPAEIHELGKARAGELRAAAIVAERVIAERERRSAARRAAMDEQEETERAIAEGRPTPAERRKQQADAARDLMRGIAAKPDPLRRYQ